MILRFETCDRQRALSFLKGHCPSCEVKDEPESAADILDLVEKDIIRIPDPQFHGGTIYPSKNWPDDTSEQEKIKAILKSGTDKILATKQKEQS